MLRNAECDEEDTISTIEEVLRAPRSWDQMLIVVDVLLSCQRKHIRYLLPRCGLPDFFVFAGGKGSSVENS
jgi:hypothetical protein